MSRSQKILRLKNAIVPAVNAGLSKDEIFEICVAAQRATSFGDGLLWSDITILIAEEIGKNGSLSIPERINS